VTFGALIEELENIRAWSEKKAAALALRNNIDQEFEHDRLVDGTKRLAIRAEGVVANNSTEVQIARKAIAMAQMYDRLKVYKNQPFYAFAICRARIG
jgi:gamma-glutamyl phosphate reductase